MTVEQLMIPRVKVVEDYPDSPYKVGDIMVFDGDLTIHPNGMDITSKYPKIFQPIPWYAERDVDVLPKYERVIDQDSELNSEVVIVTEWMNGNDDLICYINHEWFMGISIGVNILPATEQEYTDFITQKTTQL